MQFILWANWASLECFPFDFLKVTMQIIYDEKADCDPIGGLLAGLTIAETPLLLLLAVDMPDITSDLLDNLLNCCNSEPNLSNYKKKQARKVQMVKTWISGVIMI